MSTTVTVLQENLGKGLAVVGRAVSTRPTLPVLSHILVESGNGQIKLAATDLEMFITCTVLAKCEPGSSITMPARMFTDLANALSDRIDLSFNGSDSATIKSGGNKSKLKGIEANEFPLLPTAQEGTQIELDAPTLRKMIAWCLPSVADDELRPILTSVTMRCDGATLTLASADGFRLSVCSVKLDKEMPAFAVNVPGKTMAEVLRLSKETETIHLCATDRQAFFRLSDIGDAGAINDVTIISQLIEGNFPDFNQLVPKSGATRVTMNRAELLKAYKSVNIIARSDAHIIESTIGPESVTLSTTSAEMGSATATVTAQTEGESNTNIVLNARFVIDILTVAETDQVEMWVNLPSAPAVFKAGDGFTHVIMPMQVQNR